MAYPAVTYSFTNDTTADATQVNQNFTDMINGISDATKEINVVKVTTPNIGTSGATALALRTNDTTRMSIATTGMIGVGVTSGQFFDFEVARSGAVVVYNGSALYSDNTTYYPELGLLRSSTNAIGTREQTASQIVGRFAAYGVLTGGGVGSIGSIDFYQSGTAGASYNAGTVQHKVNNGSGLTEVFRLTSNANLAVGTATATVKLDVAGRVRASEVFIANAYTVVSLPTAVTGGITYVSNETGGAVLAYGDGTNWRRVTDRTIVS